MSDPIAQNYTTYGIGPGEYADELQALRAERDRLRAALQAFCDEVEMDAAVMAYKCDLGAGEWEAFIDRTKLYKQYLAGKAALTPAGGRREQ